MSDRKKDWAVHADLWLSTVGFSGNRTESLVLLMIFWPCMAALLGFMCCVQCMLLEKEGIKRTLEGVLAHWPTISICLQAFFGIILSAMPAVSVVIQLIYRVQPQPGCFLGWSSPHPTFGVHKQRDVGGFGFGKIWQVPHTCQRFCKSRFGSMALRTSIATA